jgi:hypothetical protein
MLCSLLENFLRERERERERGREGGREEFRNFPPSVGHSCDRV